jgi:hypothetical protein
MGHWVTAKPTQRRCRMSPVRIDELNPETRARVPKQISGTESGTTALATVEQETLPTLGDPATMTDDELANVVIEGVKKIRQILPYIVAIKARFDSGDRDRTNRLKTPIKGCFSWAEFCKTRLGRTRQTIHEALAPEPPLAPTPKPVASTCPDCGESFDSRGQLRRHGQSEHKISTSGIANFLRRSNGEPASPAAGRKQPAPPTHISMSEEKLRQFVESMRSAPNRIVGNNKIVPRNVVVVAREIVNAGRKVLAAKRHPDAGGSEEDMRILNAANQWLMLLINQSEEN